jgi:FemAB-related protein (PEP-CTERM system-associated)
MRGDSSVTMKAVAVDSEAGEWDSFLQSVDGATSCHQFGWKVVINKSFGHQCHYLAAIDGNGEWQGVLPLVHMSSRIFGNFLVSVPFVNYGGLLCKTASAERLLLDEAERLRRSLGAKFVELRHLEHGLEVLPTRLNKVTMILELTSDIDSQWKAFKSEVRNRIRKSQKSDLQPVIGHLDLLDEFYGVFARNMRDLGTPVYAKEFFRNVLEAFPDTTKIFAVRYQQKIIGAAIAYWYRDVLEIPWVSSVRDYMTLCPNNMLYWEAIQYAISQGFRKFDFGRSTMNETHEGTYNYKKQWGALPVQLHWQYLMDGNGEMPEINPSNPKYKAAIRVWQHLPVPVTRVLGPLIVRNIP